MMQTQWPGLGTNLDLSSLDASSGDGRALWPADPAFGSALTTQPPDSVGRPWWTCGTGTANAGNPLGEIFGGANASSASNGSLFGLVSGLVTMLQQLVGALMNQSTNPNQGPPQGVLPGGPQQRFAERRRELDRRPAPRARSARAKPATATSVNEHWDSMTSHDDLVHSAQIDGGYRVSTAVTQPDANGVTWNQSATVHANFDQDARHDEPRRLVRDLRRRRAGAARQRRVRDALRRRDGHRRTRTVR